MTNKMCYKLHFINYLLVTCSTVVWPLRRQGHAVPRGSGSQIECEEYRRKKG